MVGSNEATTPITIVNTATADSKSRDQSHLDIYNVRSRQEGSTTSGGHSTTNVLLQMAAMQQEASGFTNKSPFNPNETLFIQDKSLMKKASGVMTISHFGTKTSPRTSKSPVHHQKQYHPAIPNEKAQGHVQGQKIGIKHSPRNHNIMEELDLKGHFLKKLTELRDMKEEYYGAPEVALDPVDILAQRAAQ